MNQKNNVQLRQDLEKYFNVEELKTLAFDLGIDYESLPGLNKQEKTREIVAYSIRHERLQDLIDACRRLRPTADWLLIAETLDEMPLSEESDKSSLETFKNWLSGHGAFKDVAPNIVAAIITVLFAIAANLIAELFYSSLKFGEFWNFIKPFANIIALVIPILISLIIAWYIAMILYRRKIKQRRLTIAKLKDTEQEFFAYVDRNISALLAEEAK